MKHVVVEIGLRIECDKHTYLKLKHTPLGMMDFMVKKIISLIGAYSTCLLS